MVNYFVTVQASKWPKHTESIRNIQKTRVGLSQTDMEIKLLQVEMNAQKYIMSVAVL